jgi:hypothetical protein
MQMVRQANDCCVHSIVCQHFVVITECFFGRVFFLKFRPPRFINISARVEIDRFQGARGNCVHLARPTRADNPEPEFLHFVSLKKLPLASVLFPHAERGGRKIASPRCFFLALLEGNTCALGERWMDGDLRGPQVS